MPQETGGEQHSEINGPRKKELNKGRVCGRTVMWLMMMRVLRWHCDRQTVRQTDLGKVPQTGQRATAIGRQNTL